MRFDKSYLYILMFSVALPGILLVLTVMGMLRPSIGIVGIILSGFVLMNIMDHTLLRPLSQLSKATKKICNGDLDFTLEADREGDIGQLTQDFEDMRIRLRESREENLRSDMETKELMSNIVHDLKTPITAIKGYSEGILDGVASDPAKQEKYIRTINSKAEDMSRMIDELNLYMKLETNRVPYHYVRLKVREFFDGLAAEAELDLQAADIIFSYRNDLSPEVRIIADPEQLRRVVNNVISNSVKYMDKEPGRISMVLTDVGDFIQCDLEDNGKGVEKENLSRIFERFYRTDNSRNSSKGGSGIGLSIVKKVIEDCGGRVWATGVEGQGLAIHFQIRKYFEPRQEMQNG